jgi:hypothetical protein
MPHEPLSNIGMVCSAHLKKPDPQFLKKPKKWFVGKYCKLAFPIVRSPAKERQELMWVRVICLAKQKVEELRGILDNDPVLADFACGDIIEFSRSEIIEVEDGNDTRGVSGTDDQRGHRQRKETLAQPRANTQTGRQHRRVRGVSREKSRPAKGTPD